MGNRLCRKDEEEKVKTGCKDAIEYTVEELLSQSIYGIVLGYEDLSDHDQLRINPLLAVLCKKKDPTGQDRRSRNEKGKALAGKSMLNRLELTPADAGKESQYKKIVYQGKKMERFFIDAFLRSHKEKPERIVLDLDATDDAIHGNQEGRFFPMDIMGGIVIYPCTYFVMTICYARS